MQPFTCYKLELKTVYPTIHHHLPSMCIGWCRRLICNASDAPPGPLHLHSHLGHQSHQSHYHSATAAPAPHTPIAHLHPTCIPTITTSAKHWAARATTTPLDAPTIATTRQAPDQVVLTSP